jgi:hypothetical protein
VKLVLLIVKCFSKNFTARDPEVNYNHAAKQAYIGLGTALIAALKKVLMLHLWKVLMLKLLTKF